MNTIALARRYRPRTFEAVVGHEITVRALQNALNSQQLHHAYLFTGTRGVGKTTIARILAKCLNCELKISATPCGQCQSCLATDAGAFEDFIEVDAASRTKVEDTRALLENVQYLPARGRFKIYLIDEVHMLSGHSFNALLKTLEEPPEHVKFILATTDPQKLPVTVLSRCLQFHLWRLSIAELEKSLAALLQKEQVTLPTEAVALIAEAADGSLRDAQSLLDQVFSLEKTTVSVDDVRALLGLAPKGLVLKLLQAVFEGDSQAALNFISILSEGTVEFSHVLTELQTLLHHIAIAQQVPDAMASIIERWDEIVMLASCCTSETIQLYYQISVDGQRDLPYAPNSRMGFEMVVLRMIAFQPVQVSLALGSCERKNLQETWIPSPVATPQIDWSTVVAKLNVSGLAKVLVENTILSELTEETIQLTINDNHKHLVHKRSEEQLQAALSQYFQKPLRLIIKAGSLAGETPAVKNERLLKTAHHTAQHLINQDPNIQSFIQNFDAKIENISLKES